MNAKPTPGPWLARPELQRPDFEPHTPGGCVDLGYRQIHGMTCEHAVLIAEAGTVHHETGLTPREILAQRDELLKAAIHVLGILESPKPNKPGGVSRDMLREAIAKVMNEGINASKGGEKG